jgi:hypothetical protein
MKIKKINNKNYLDNILINNLSSIRIIPQTSWDIFHKKYISTRNVGTQNLLKHSARYSTMKLITGMLIILSISSGVYLIIKNSNNRLKNNILINKKDTTFKSYQIKKSLPENDTLKISNEKKYLNNNSNKKDTVIRIKVPVQKNVIIKKQIILRDSLRN